LGNSAALGSVSSGVVRIGNRVLRHSGAVLMLTALGATAVGCAAPGGRASPSPNASPSPSPMASPQIVAAPVGDFVYTCGRFPFPPELMTAPPRNDELLQNPVAAALRAHLAKAGPDFDFLPDSGWNLVGADGSAAEFVAVGGENGMKTVSLANGPTGWKVDGWGDCRAQIALPTGLNSAAWAWAGQGGPNPTTQVFDALVTERTCTSGQSADGRVVPPKIVFSADSVLVMFAVRTLDPTLTYTCQSNPATRVKVDLGQPLGARKLLDAGSLPFRDATTPIQ
jgi:hypothetical protein